MWWGLIGSYSFHELLDLGFAELGALVGQPAPKLVHGDRATVVRVHAPEHLLQPLDLLLGQASGNNLYGNGSKENTPLALVSE